MFNLLNETEVSNCYGNLNILPSDMALNRVLEVLNLFRDLKVTSEVLEFDEDGFLTLGSKDCSRRIHFKSILSFAEKLEFLESFKGFLTLSEG